MDLGVGGRGGARRRTRRRANARASMQASQQSDQKSNSSDNSPAAMLEMLKVLHNEGILTDEEFMSKKTLLVEKM